MEHLEVIKAGELPLAYIVRGSWRPRETNFLTPGDVSLQLGMIVYGAGEAITPHVHRPVTRQVEGTSECVIVREGSCEIDIYDGERRFLATRKLDTGDIVLLLGGGHGFRMLQNTVLFEVKQGPYVGNADKERF